MNKVNEIEVGCVLESVFKNVDPNFKLSMMESFDLWNVSLSSELKEVIGTILTENT